MFYGSFFSFQYFARSSRLANLTHPDYPDFVYRKEDDFQGEMAAYQRVANLKNYRKLITEQEIDSIRPTYKFNMIAGLSDIIQTRDEVEYILNADDKTLERLENNLQLVFSHNITRALNLTIPQLMAYPDEVLESFGKNVNPVLKLKKHLLKDEAFDAILKKLTPEAFRFYDRYDSFIRSKEDLNILSNMSLDDMANFEQYHNLVGIYELNFQDIVNLKPEFAEKLQACRRYFANNHSIYGDDFETHLTKKDILNLSLQQLDNISWFENNIIQYSSSSFPAPQPATRTIKQFYIIANLDDEQKNKLSLGRKADVVTYYGIEKIIGFSMEQLQTISEKIAPYFKNIFSEQLLYQKVGDKLRIEPHQLRHIEVEAHALRKKELDSVQIDREGRKELEEAIQALLSKEEKQFPDAELADSNFLNVSPWTLVHYPNSVKAYLADGTIKEAGNYNDNLLNLVKYATRENCSVSLTILLDHPAEKTTDYQAELNKSLLVAAENGFLECVKILVDHGANLNCSSSNTAFEKALLNDHVPIAKYLWQKFHSIASNYNTEDTPMHVAAKRGQHEILRMMIEDGAEVDPRGYKKTTPLDMAIQSTGYGVSRENTLKTIELLLEAGANPNAIVDTRTVYGATQQLYDADYRKKVQALIQSKSKYKVKGDWGDFGNPIDDHSDFFNAAYHGDIERFKKYLNLYDVRISSHNGETALHFAAKNSQYDMAEFLLEKGINPSQKGGSYNSKKTALELANDKNDVQMVRIIASHSKPQDLPETRKKPGALFFGSMNFKSEEIRIIIDDYKYGNGKANPNSAYPK